NHAEAKAFSPQQAAFRADAGKQSHLSTRDTTAMQMMIQAPCAPVLPALAHGGRAPAAVRKYNGDGHDILLQGFHWAAHCGAHDSATRSRKCWYRVMRENAPAIRAAGFS